MAQLTCITPKQRDLHVTMESVALVAVVPFMFWLSAHPRLEPWARRSALGIGVGTLLVDGYLLSWYIRRGAKIQTQTASQGQTRPAPNGIV